jgi:hypothetical protein
MVIFRYAKVAAALSALFVLCAAGDRADAATVSTQLATYGNRITFDEIVLPTNSALTNQYSALGVTFSAGTVYDPYIGIGPMMGDLFTGFSGHTAGNFGFMLDPTSPISISFGSHISDFSFAAVSADQSTEIRALLDGSPVESAMVNTGAGASTMAAVEFGFTGLDFNEIQIFSPSAGAPQAFVFDDLRFNDIMATPLPATLPLFASTLVGLGVLWQRRRRRKPTEDENPA